jgi:hypothetical protein
VAEASRSRYAAEVRAVLFGHYGDVQTALLSVIGHSPIVTAKSPTSESASRKSVILNIRT